MKRFSEQLNTRAQSVKLRAAEKRELRERVVSYMEYHPLPAEMKAMKTAPKKVQLPQTAEPFTSFQIPFTALFKYSAFTAAFLLVVIPFVAERAVPGDALYSVKVHLNEEVRSTLTFDTYQKVEWETERLNRRIAEARLLASEGRLTEEAEADVAEAVRTHSANAQREIAELREEDEDAATIASISLDTTLELQSSSLRGEDDIVAKGNKEELTSKNERPINLIASAIDESRTKKDETTASSTLPAYGKLMAKIEQNTTRIYELLSALEKVAPAEDLIDVNRRAEDINRAIQEAVDTAVEDELSARLQLVAVLQRTQRLIVYMTELEVIKTIDIETLIPVVLTEEEEDTKRTEVVDELTAKVEIINSLLEQVENEEILAKGEFGRKDLVTTLAEIVSMAQDFKEFKILAKDGDALADDLLTMLKQEQSGLPVEVEVEVSTTTPTSTEEIIDEEQVPTSTPITIEEGAVGIGTSSKPNMRNIREPRPIE